MTPEQCARSQVQKLKQLRDLTPVEEDLKPDLLLLQQVVEKRTQILCGLTADVPDPEGDPVVEALVEEARLVAEEIGRRDRVLIALLEEARDRLLAHINRVDKYGADEVQFEEAGNWIA